MFIVFIPWIIILFFALAICGVVSNIMDINIMPIVSILSLIFMIMGFVKASRCKDEEKTPNLIIAVASLIFLLISLCTSCTPGDMVSCLWYCG